MKLSPQIDNSIKMSIPPYKRGIELELEKVFDIEKQIDLVDQTEIYKIQFQINKIILKYSEIDKIITPLDALRVDRFQERIGDIYDKYEPTTQDLKYAEKLISELV
jgi:hypothetical protein